MRDVLKLRADSAFAVRDHDPVHPRFDWDVPGEFNFGADVIDRWAHERDRPALIWENEAGDRQTLRYSDISRLSNKLGNALRNSGLSKGDRVLVQLPRIPEWIISLVAIMKIGAVPIPCIEMLTARDVEYRVKNSRSAAVICRDVHAAKFRSVEQDISIKIALGDVPGWLNFGKMIRAGAEAPASVAVAAEDPAIMYYTSGSTGYPKAVVHAARAVYAWRSSALYWLDLTENDRIWCTADTGWSKAGTSILFGPLSCGACTLLYDGPFVPEQRLRILADNRVTVFCAPPTELKRLLRENIDRYDLSALRRAVTGGEAMDRALGANWEAATKTKVYEAYGLTESLIVVMNLEGMPLRYGSMGRSGPGSNVEIIDDNGEVLPAGEEGDIAVEMPHPQMMLSYWEDVERTAACFRERLGRRWFVTGDRAVKDVDGYFWYRCRADDVISSAGYRIGPLEVEIALQEHSSVQQCAVIGSPDPERGEVVKAFVVLAEGFSPSPDLTKELQDHVKSMTAPYKYPRVIVYLESLPMTDSVKINRRALRALP